MSNQEQKAKNTNNQRYHLQIEEVKLNFNQNNPINDYQARRASMNVDQINSKIKTQGTLQLQTRQIFQEQQQVNRQSGGLRILGQSPNKLSQQKRTGDFSNKQSIHNFLSQHQNDLIDQSANQDESQRSKSISAADLQNSMSKSTISNQPKSLKKGLTNITNRSVNIHYPIQRFSRGILPSKTQNIINLIYSSKKSSQVIIQNPEIVNQQNPDSGSTNNINKKQESKESDSSSEQLSQIGEDEEDEKYNIFDVRHRSNINKIKDLKKKNKELKLTIKNTKVFLNMVIHDLRNPTSQISFTIQFIIDYLKKQNESKYFHIQELLEFFEKYERELQSIIENLKHEMAQEQLFHEQNTYKLLEKIQQMQSEIIRYKTQIDIFENQFLRSHDPSIPSERIQDKRINIQNEISQTDLFEQSKINDFRISEFINQIKQRKEVFLQNFEKMFKEKSNVQQLDKSLEKINMIDEYIQNIKSQNSVTEVNPKILNNSIIATCMFDLAEEDQNGRIIMSFEDKNNKDLKSQILKPIESLSYEQQKKYISDQRNNDYQMKIQNEAIQSKKQEEITLLRRESGEIESLSILRGFQEEWMNLRNSAAQFREFMSQDENQVFDLLQTCSHSSSMLLNLINDLLDLAKHEKLTFKVNKDYFNFIQTIENTFKTMDFLAQKRNIKMILKIDPSQKKYYECFFGDEKRWEQIFLNFISNSLKFTNDNGNVTVEVNLLKCAKAVSSDEIQFVKSFNRSNEETKNNNQQKEIKFNSNQNNMTKKSVQFSLNAEALENLSYQIQTLNEKNSLNSNNQAENKKQLKKINKKEVNSNKIISNLKKLSFQGSQNFKQNQQIENSDSFFTLKNQPSVLEQINNLKLNLKERNLNTEANTKSELQLIKFEVKIIDDGEGISQEGIKQLFMNFNTLDEHKKNNLRGTGLGLSICKQIIENMGGRVNVQSKINQGTTFTITLNSLCFLKQSNLDDGFQQVSNMNQVVQESLPIHKLDQISNSELTNLFFQNVSLLTQQNQQTLMNHLQNIDNTYSYNNNSFLKHPVLTYDHLKIKINKFDLNDSSQYQLHSNNKNNSFDMNFKSNQNSMTQSIFDEEQQSKFQDQKQQILNTNDLVDAILTSEASEIFHNDKTESDKKNLLLTDIDHQEQQNQEKAKSIKESLSQIDEEDNKHLSSTSSAKNIKRQNLNINIKKLELMNSLIDSQYNHNKKLKSNDSCQNSIQSYIFEKKQVPKISIEDYMLDDEDSSQEGPSNIIKKYNQSSKGNFINLKNKKQTNQLSGFKKKRSNDQFQSQDITHNNSSLQGKSIILKKGKSNISRKSQNYLECLNVNNSTQLNVLIQDISKEMDDSDQIQQFINSQNNSQKSPGDLQARQQSNLSSIVSSFSQMKIKNKNNSSNGSSYQKCNFNQISVNKSAMNEIFPSLKILVANDDPMQLLILKSLFSKLNGIKIDLHTANNGQEAYELATFQKPFKQLQKLNTKEIQSEIQTIQASIKGEIIESNIAFDIIILDLNMPIMDGIQSCKSIRKFQKEAFASNDGQNTTNELNLQKQPFIVALSASNFNETQIQDCVNQGFDEYMGVPLSFDDLRFKVIHKYLIEFKGFSKDQILLLEDHHQKIVKSPYLQSPNVSSIRNYSSGLSFLQKFNQPQIIKRQLIRNNSLGNTDHDQNLSLMKNQKPKKLPTANVQVKSKFSQQIQN